MRALTTCRAGISTLAPVAGLWPMRFSRCCTTSFATPGSTNSPHRSNSCPVNRCSSSKNAPASARLMPRRSAKCAYSSLLFILRDSAIRCLSPLVSPSHQAAPGPPRSVRSTRALLTRRCLPWRSSTFPCASPAVVVAVHAPLLRTIATRGAVAMIAPPRHAVSVRPAPGAGRARRRRRTGRGPRRLPDSHTTPAPPQVAQVFRIGHPPRGAERGAGIGVARLPDNLGGFFGRCARVDAERRRYRRRPGVRTRNYTARTRRGG